jgi:hypothetical protein
MRISRAVWVAAIIVFVAVDVALWYLSAHVHASVRPAFIGAASAWGVAVVGLGSGLIGAWLGHLYATRAALQAECRVAYARLIVFADRYADAQTDFRNVVEDLQKAEDAESTISPGTPEAKRAADVVSREAAKLQAARDGVNAQLDEFVQARATVWLLSSSDVQDSLRSLSEAAAKGQDDFRTARDAFLNVVRKDLGLPALPTYHGEHPNGVSDKISD